MQFPKRKSWVAHNTKENNINVLIILIVLTLNLDMNVNQHMYVVVQVLLVRHRRNNETQQQVCLYSPAPLTGMREGREFSEESLREALRHTAPYWQHGSMSIAHIDAL